MIINKCPQCGSVNIVALNDKANNIKYGLVKVVLAEPKPKICVDNVIVVDVFGCSDCKTVFFRNEQL